MIKCKIKHQNNSKKVKEQELLFDDIQNEVIDTDGIENLLQEDVNIFLLNNLLMSVQFFENYDRDINLLREHWSNEFSLDSHHKKCFYADTLFRLSSTNVRFSPRHGLNKNSQSPLHPFRLYISSDNVDAAFDPSVLGRHSVKVWPEYQFSVRTDEISEKAGCISLIEFKTILEPNRGKFQRNTCAFESKESNQRTSIYIQNKNNFDEKSTRRFTKTEMSIGLLNKDLNLKILGKRCSLRFNPTPDDTIPANGFYKFENPERRLKPKMIYDLRMNSVPASSHEIPQLCFQYEEVRNKLKNRRVDVNSCFRTQRVLNSAAFKGYFCDLLIEKLAEPLDLDSDDVDAATVHEEFLIVNQNGAKHHISPVINIRDWNNFIEITRIRNNVRSGELEWPTPYMQEIMKILPCSAVPASHACPFQETVDYEKSWTLVFPQTEEFLLLHLMHSHIRCYFFVLLIYKSFIESEINRASFGPKHLLHLLFWKVHKNFLAWPDDRPGETLLNYLETLYKKLKNKYLRDFFITSRNLFASSLPKDLHRAQSMIKKIIENPVPYLIRAISNLSLQENFYPPFDYSKLNQILVPPIPEKIKKEVKVEKPKKVHFEDEERLWKKQAHKQIELEKKAEIKEETAKLSVDSVNVNDILNFDSDNRKRCNQVLKIFTSHFLQMGSKSMEYNCLPQGLMYLYQTQKLLQLLADRGMARENLKEMEEHIFQLKQSCYNKIKQELRKSPGKPRKFLGPSQKQEKNLEDSETREQKKEAEVVQEILDHKSVESSNVDENGSDEDVVIKL